MLFFSSFFICLVLSLYLFGVLTVYVKKPVLAVFFLILTFCFSAFVLVLFGVEFLGFLFVIIYVGAIAVLFLFVVMMLDLKDNRAFFSFNYYVLTTILMIFILNFFLATNFSLKDFSYIVQFENIMDLSFNIDIFGQFLYNFYSSCFLIAGIILLLALVGAIVLTLNYKAQRKNEIVSRQLSRTNIFLSFFE